MPVASEHAHPWIATPGRAALAVSVRMWPGLLDRGIDDAPDVAETDAWVRTTGSALRVTAPGGDLSYEEAVLRGMIPCREGSWHDVFNVLSFVRFAAAKTALHRRVLALRRARLGAEPAARGRRSREEDALTLVDECALLLGGSARSLARLQHARDHGDLRAVDDVVRGERIAVACFGHALLEHVMLRRPPIGAGVVPLLVDATTDDAFDRALCDAIEAGAFDAPRLSPTVSWPDPIVDAWFDQLGTASPRTCSTGSAGSSR